MSSWQQYECVVKIREILRDNNYEHHLARPYTYMAPLQIAVEFARRFPTETAALGFPIGGVGTGNVETLGRYIARQLSREIKAGRITDIEISFLSNLHLQSLQCKGPEGQTIPSSSPSTQYPASIFRLVM